MEYTDVSQDRLLPSAMRKRGGQPRKGGDMAVLCATLCALLIRRFDRLSRVIRRREVTHDF